MIKTEVLRKIYKEIDNLPPIPKNVSKLLKIIKDPEVKISDISAQVKLDVGLTANILRLANSPWYLPIKKVNTVDRAIALIGLQRLYSIILAIGAKKIINERYKSVKEAWKHSYQCGFFALNIIKLQQVSLEDAEMAYIAGLLHDMGKVVLLALSPQLIQRITAVSETRGISVTAIEKTALGLSHSEIGAKIAGKWKFPQMLIQAIEHHHNPTAAQEDFQPIVYAVYLANILCKLKEAQEETMADIEPKVLKHFAIDSKDPFLKTVETLIDTYSIAPEIQFL